MERRKVSGITLIILLMNVFVLIFPVRAPLSVPNMAVRPQYLEFGPFPPAYGTNFDVRVYIENLDVGWALTNASFTLSYNASLTEVVSISVDPAWTGPNTVNITTLGVIDAFVQTSASLSGDVLVITIRFCIIERKFAPPMPVGYFDQSVLAFGNIKLMSGAVEIPTNPPEAGLVKVYAQLWLSIAWVVIADPSTGEQFNKTLSIEQEFDVNINIEHLHSIWHLVGVQFRLSYDPTLLEVISISEGPYLQSFGNRANPPYTMQASFVESDAMFGPNILKGSLLLPNETGQWTNFPGEPGIGESPTGPLSHGTLATVRFKTLAPTSNPSVIGLSEVILGDENALYIPVDYSRNGTFTVEGGQKNALLNLVGANSSALNGNSELSMTGLTVTFQALGSYPGHPRWNPDADFDKDGYVNIIDCILRERTLIHDVAIIGIKLSKTVVGQGYSMFINVTVENQGDYTEAFNATVYANTTEIETQEITLSSGNFTSITFTWDTTGFALGNYTISAIADAVTNETDTLDNTYTDGIVTVRLPVHDIAVVDVTASKNVVGQGYSMSINVIVANQGDYTETFNITVYANTTTIATLLTNITLTSGNSTNMTFTWNTSDFAKGNYTIWAYAWPVQGETYTTDNILTDGSVFVGIVGDVNGNRKVDLDDVLAVAIAYGSFVGMPKYKPNLDIDGNGKIDLTDYLWVAINYGKTDP